MDDNQYRHTMEVLTNCQESLVGGDRVPLGPEESEARRQVILLAIDIALNNGHNVGMPVIQEY